jgi:hypothetical protein
VKTPCDGARLYVGDELLDTTNDLYASEGEATLVESSVRMMSFKSTRSSVHPRIRKRKFGSTVSGFQVIRFMRWRLINLRRGANWHDLCQIVLSCTALYLHNLGTLRPCSYPLGRFTPTDANTRGHVNLLTNLCFLDCSPNSAHCRLGLNGAEIRQQHSEFVSTAHR